MGRCGKVLLTAFFGLALAAEAPQAQPTDLELVDLDQITGGAWRPTTPLFDRSSFDRRSYITSSVSIPIANAFAVCFMCSGDASAVAIAGAFGNARADANSFASGRGQAFTRAEAVGPHFVFVVPGHSQPPISHGQR